MFLNADYDEYILGDSNPDLINLYLQLTTEQKTFIRYCKSYFSEKKNNEDWFYKHRSQFNQIKNTQRSKQRRKAALFLYLNRHCYNGLCRYNSRGEFNTPFGRYKKPYFPLKEMQNFILCSTEATFVNANFDETMLQARSGDVIYCDPPYAPLTDTAYFTDYHVGGFNWDDQLLLAELAENLAKKNIPVVISNHDTKQITKLYKEKGAKIIRFDVQRNISCKGNSRKKVKEILAIF